MAKTKKMNPDNRDPMAQPTEEQMKSLRNRINKAHDNGSINEKCYWYFQGRMSTTHFFMDDWKHIDDALMYILKKKD